MAALEEQLSLDSSDGMFMANSAENDNGEELAKRGGRSRYRRW